MIAHPPPPIRGHDHEHHATVNGKRCIPCDRGWARVHKPHAHQSNTGWVIPTYIVMCESGGQNLLPNSAGASGFYQDMPETWRSYGGRTANAYEASRSEQDQVNARIWDGGRGASQWVCS